MRIVPFDNRLFGLRRLGSSRRLLVRVCLCSCSCCCYALALESSCWLERKRNRRGKAKWVYIYIYLYARNRKDEEEEKPVSRHDVMIYRSIFVARVKMRETCTYSIVPSRNGVIEGFVTIYHLLRGDLLQDSPGFVGRHSHLRNMLAATDTKTGRMPSDCRHAGFNMAGSLACLSIYLVYSAIDHALPVYYHLQIGLSGPRLLA